MPVNMLLAGLGTLPLRGGHVGGEVQLLLGGGAGHDHAGGYGPGEGGPWQQAALNFMHFININPAPILTLLQNLRVLLLILLLWIAIVRMIRHGQRVQYVHAHRTLLLDDEPLVDAIIVEVVVARLQHLDELLVGDQVEADGAVVDLDLGGLPGHRQR